MTEQLPLVLASRSPARRALLERLGVAFEVRPADVAERDRGDPASVAAANALAKARAATRAARRERVLGVDTLVSYAGTIYGKPADEEQAHRILRALAGAQHEVLSGLAVVDPHGERVVTARTLVTFRAMSDAALRWYLGTGEWRGRAGAYAIQGAGAALVRGIEGEYENVVGLPLGVLLDLCPRLIWK